MANSDKNIRITTSKNKTTYPNIVFTGSAAGSSVITLEVLDDNTLSFTSNEGQVFSIDSILSTGTIWAVSDISGVPMLSSSAGGTVGLAVYGGIVGIGQTNPAYKLDLKGSFGLASANDGLYNFIFSNSAASGSNSLEIRSANSLLLFNSGNTFYTGFKSNAATNITYTLPTTDGSSGQFLQTNGTGTLTWATATGSGGTGSTAGVGQGGQYEMAYYPGTGLSVVGSNTFTNNTVTGVVSITHSTASTNFSNGALKVSGGVGIGGSLFVGGIGASISGITFSNSLIIRGTWNATAIAPQYGGTGQNFSSSTGLLRYNSGTASVITSSSDLANVISDDTGSGALVFATGPVLVTPNIGAATGTSLYLSATSPSSSTTTGALIVPGGVGIGGSTYIGGMLRVGTDTFTKSYSQGDVLLDNGTTDTPAVRYYWANNKNFGTDVFSVGVGSTRYRIVRDINETGGIELFSVDATGAIQIYNGSSYSGFRYSGSGQTIYTLPNTSPATGSSVLQSTAAGILSWVPMVAASSSGAGSGTVAIPDAQFRLAFYAGTGASVSSTNLITAVGTGVTILGTTNASSTTVAALSIIGGLGVTGNAFIGGTTSVTSTQTSISTVSGALVVAGGVGIGGSLYTGTSVASSISGVVLSNGLVTSGTWSGTVITALYGGTGFNSYSVGDLLVASTGTSLAKLAASSNSGYVLTSTGSNSVPTWQAVPPAAATSVAVAPTVVNGQFSITTVNSSSGSGLGLSTIASFVINPLTGLVTISGLAVTNGTNSSSTTTGTLTVYGGLGITGNAFIGGTTSVTSSAVSVGTNSGALVVTGGVGIGGSLFTGTSVASSVSGVILSNGAVTASTVNKVTVSTPASAATLTLANNSSLITSGGNSLTLTTSGTTDVTFPTSGTLVNTAVTSLGSLTTASSLNTVGTITSGTWAGTVITALYGGTGFNSYSVGDLLVASTGTSLAKLSAGSLNFVLTSNGPGTVPTWQSVPASSASSVATVSNNNDALFFPTFVGTATGSGQGLTTDSDFTYNPGKNQLTVTNITGTAATYALYTNQIQIGNNGNNININDSAGTTIANFNTSNGWFRSAQTTESSNTGTGSLVTLGGLGVAKNAFIGGTTVVTNSNSSVSPTSGALSVTGGLGLAGNAFIGGTVNITSSAVSIGTNSGALVVTGGVGIGGSLYTGTSVASSISGVIHSNGAVTASTVNRLTLTAPATSATLTLANGSSLITSGGHSLTFNTTATTSITLPTTGTLATTSNKLSDFAATTSSELLNTITGETVSGALVFATSPEFTTSITTPSTTFSVFNATATAINAFGAATTISIGANSGKATFNSLDNSTSTTTGAIVATGGAAVGQSLSIGGRLQIFNSTNYSAFRYTGIANTTYTLPPNSPQASVGTSVLASTIDGTMSWVGLPVASGSGSPGGSNQQIQYNNGGAFGGATGMTWNDGSNLLTLSATGTLAAAATQVALRIINNNNTDPTSNIRWSPALEFVGRSGVTPAFGSTYNNRFTTEVVPQAPSDYKAYLRTKYSYDLITGSPSYTNDIFRIHSTLGVGIGASNSTSNAISYFRISTTQSGDVSYILPPGLPSTGTSVLQSTTAGVLSWVPMIAGSPGGSGTVNSGTAGSVAFYAADGTAVSGTGLIQVLTSGIAVSVFTNFDLRSQNKIRFFNSGNTFRTELHAGANSANYALALPTAPVGVGYSVILVDTSGQMYFAPAEGGLATTSVTGNRVVLRNKMEHHVWMSAGYTPTAAGPDSVVYLIPDSSDDGNTKITFQVKEFTIRVETPSAGSSRIQLERSSTDTGAFTLAATGSSLIGGFGLTVAGAGIYVTSTNTFTAGTFVTSGNLLRLNYTLLNATHANFSVQFTLNEV